ncbi:flippase [Vibrio parahaemolyticus]|uniref:flippase n=1 Tax=Vibrio parahaemolyticus TaxID=670 RepID=UPI0004DF3FE6|nr:flippase [Vibrio parahaemolyticus]MDF4565563.1 flippase [Vibrio parahaemolyticus]MDF5006354.1 flippase [Vibrio parahaemolyticus]
MFDKILVKNIGSLFGIKLAGYVIPLITLPYLVRTLGIESYGYLGFSIAIVQYFVLFVNYGFDLSATSHIAKNGNDKRAVSFIFWNVILLRILFSFLGLMVLLVLNHFIDEFRGIGNILLACYLTVFGTAIFPQWLFQGKEQLGLISVIRVVLQIISVPLLLFFVKNDKSVIEAALIGSLPIIGVAVISLFIIWKRDWLCWVRPSWKGMKHEFNEGWHIFLSTAAVSMYTTSVTVVLGFLSGPTSVGYFVAADKLIKAVLGFFSPISSAFYPRINAAVSRNKQEAISLIKKLFQLQVSISVITSVAIFVFSHSVTKILFGENFSTTAELLKVLALLPVLISISNVFGIQILIPFGFQKLFSRILILSGVMSLVLLFLLTSLFNEYGAAASVLLTETFVAFSMWYVVSKKNILKW